MGKEEIAALKSKIDMLRIVYFIVFALSLGMIAMKVDTVLWAITLGSAVAIRLYRSSLVNKYNAAITKGPAPLV